MTSGRLQIGEKPSSVAKRVTLGKGGNGARGVPQRGSVSECEKGSCRHLERTKGNHPVPKKEALGVGGEEQPSCREGGG